MMRRLITLALILSAILGLGVATPDANATIRKQIFEGWLHANRPNVYDGKEKLGIRHLDSINAVNQSYLTGLWTDTANLPPTAWYDALAANYSHPDNILPLDIEYWPSTTQAERLATSAKFVTVYNEMKTRRPDLQIGFYSFPLTGIHKFIWTTGLTASESPGGTNFIAWQAENDDFATLWAVVDIIFPALYYPYDRVNDVAAPISQPYIHNYFHYNILDTRRCITAYSTKNPPIISYVWHQDTHPHDIDIDVWDDMVQTAYTEGDGMILWSINTQAAWNDNDWWWINFKHKFPFGDRQLLKARQSRTATPTPAYPVIGNRTTGTAVHLGTSITLNHSHDASINSALVACVPYQDNEVTTWTATATPGGAMTLIANNQVTSDGVAAFVLTNPPAGPISIVISAGATTITDFNAHAISFQNVNQSTPTRTAYTDSATTGTFGLTVVNSQAGDIVVACDVLVATSAPVNAYQDKTNTTDSIIGSSARSSALSTKYATGGSTTTGLSVTSSTWRGIAFSLIPYGGS